jgi:hypothetical protein
MRSRKNVEIIVDGQEKIELGNEKTITFLLDLKNAKAGEIINALNPLKSNFTTLVPYQALNMVIFSGNSTEIDGLIKIARALDRAPKSRLIRRRLRMATSTWCTCRMPAPKSWAKCWPAFPFLKQRLSNNRLPRPAGQLQYPDHRRPAGRTDPGPEIVHCGQQTDQLSDYYRNPGRISGNQQADQAA